MCSKPSKHFLFMGDSDKYGRGSKICLELIGDVPKREFKNLTQTGELIQKINTLLYLTKFRFPL